MKKLLLISAALCLFARESQLVCYGVDARSAVLLFIVAIAWGAEVNFVGTGPFRLDVGSRLFATLFWHMLFLR